MARQSVVMETVMTLVLIKSPGTTCWVDGGQDLPKFFIRLRDISLFRGEITACAAVHMRYDMDTCNHAQPIILLPPMMGTSFVLVALTKLIVSKPKHQVT